MRLRNKGDRTGWKHYGAVKDPPPFAIGIWCLRRVLPWEICASLTHHVSGTIGLFGTQIFFALTHTTLDVIKGKPKFMLHVVGWMISLLHPFVILISVPCLQFPTFTLQIAHVLACIDNAFWNNWEAIWQCTTRNQSPNLMLCEQHHAPPMKWLLHAYFSWSCVRAWNGVFHFVRAMVVALNHKWQVKLTVGGPKQLKLL